MTIDPRYNDIKLSYAITCAWINLAPHIMKLVSVILKVHSNDQRCVSFYDLSVVITIIKIEGGTKIIITHHDL